MMKILKFNYDSKYIMMSATVDGVTHLLRVDMKDCPLTLLGVFEAMDTETFTLIEGECNDIKEKPKVKPTSTYFFGGWNDAKP